MKQKMNILETIIASKKIEIKSRSAVRPVSALRRHPFYSRQTISLSGFLSDENGSGIIAEFKRKSPSKGLLNGEADLLNVTKGYASHGAAGLSVLTDFDYFGGTTEDLIAARENKIPILRKDFIIDEYQVEESKSMGADVILLIAACLEPARIKRLASQAKSLGLEVLLEVHNRKEIDHICDEVDLVGVNNRDLKTFAVDLNRSFELIEWIPSGKISISESGIHEADTVHKLRQSGFRGFLMGENFMKQPDPVIAFASFVKELKKRPHEGKSLRHDATGPGENAG